MSVYYQQELGTLQGTPQVHTFVLVCVDIYSDVSYKWYQINLGLEWHFNTICYIHLEQVPAGTKNTAPS